MKPFVVNRYGRIVFPFNFFPELDFSVFQTLEQFAAVIRRDFEEKAPTEADIVARVEGRGYTGRYELLRDLALDLFWVNRYAHDHVREAAHALARRAAAARRRLPAGVPTLGRRRARQPPSRPATGRCRRRGTRAPRTRSARILLDVFRHKKGAGAELPAIKPTVGEILANPKNLTYHLLAYDPDYPGYGVRRHHRVRPSGCRSWKPSCGRPWCSTTSTAGTAPRPRLIEVGQLHDDDFVVVFQPRSDDVVALHPARQGLRRRPRPRKPAPARSRRARGALSAGRRAASASRSCRGSRRWPCYKGERACTNDDLIRNAAYCWSPMTAAGDPGEDRHRAAPLHRARPRPHGAPGGPAGPREGRAATRGDRRRALLLVHQHEDDAVARHLALRAARHVPDPRLAATWWPPARAFPTGWPRRCACSRRSSARSWWCAERSSPTRSARCAPRG